MVFHVSEEPGIERFEPRPGELEVRPPGAPTTKRDGCATGEGRGRSQDTTARVPRITAVKSNPNVCCGGAHLVESMPL